MNISNWYAETVGDDTPNKVAENAGIVPPSLYRQLPDRLSPQNVVKIARAYGVPAIDGLVALGLLDDTDLDKLEISDALRAASDRDLLNELARRLESRPEQTEWGQPIIIDTQVLAAKYGDTEREQEAFEELP